jgi:hypothetical protein
VRENVRQFKKAANATAAIWKMLMVAKGHAFRCVKHSELIHRSVNRY